MIALWEARIKWYNIGLALELPPDELEEVRRIYQNRPNECFRELLQRWLRRGTPQPTWSAIVRALRTKIVCRGHLAYRVENSYILSGNSAKGKENTPSNNKDSTDGPLFTCPCGECSFQSYLKNSCPKSKSSSFPYLNWNKLNNDQKEKENLFQRLSNDFEKMRMHFIDLFDKVCTSLKSSVATAEELACQVIVFTPQLLSKEDEKELRGSKSVTNSLMILRKYMSFFNFKLLERIVHWDACPKECHEHLAQYQKILFEFCRRKVFEVSPNAYSDMDVHKTEHTKFVVWITDDNGESSDLNDIRKVRLEIANLLDLDLGDLHLHTIDQGSLIMVFSIPELVADRLFPLSHELLYKLKSAGYMIFTERGILL